eukprot:9420754-Lingulodinium_polyedra.AAC.1
MTMIAIIVISRTITSIVAFASIFYGHYESILDLWISRGGPSSYFGFRKGLRPESCPRVCMRASNSVVCELDCCTVPLGRKRHNLLLSRFGAARRRVA